MPDLEHEPTATFHDLIDAITERGYEARIPFIATGRGTNPPENAVQTPNAQQLFNAFRVALRDELTRLHAEHPDIYVTDPFNPPEAPFYNRLAEAITAAHQKERFR